MENRYFEQIVTDIIYQLLYGQKFSFYRVIIVKFYIFFN